MIIKILLIIGLLAAANLLFRGKVSATQLAIRRLGAGVVLALGVVSVLFPIVTTKVANIVGVSRGTDLVLYVLVIAFLMTSVTLYRKVHDLEESYVDLARHFAISEVEQRVTENRSAETQSTSEQI